MNRYEHAIGTAHLAGVCMSTWPTLLTPTEEKQVVLAALVHDVQSPAFGHSVQYTLDRKGFQHEALWHLIGPSRGQFAYQDATLEPIFFGLPRRLREVVEPALLESVLQIVQGLGRYGKLISGTVDLDNIDNVYRLAYHIGLTRDTLTPLNLASALSVDPGGDLRIVDAAADHLFSWYEVRRRLYAYLLLNPDEFSAKCMLEEALLNVSDVEDPPFRWVDVDFQLMEALHRSSATNEQIVQRLMIGDLYGCLGIYETKHVSRLSELQDSRRRLEEELTKSVRSGNGPRFRSADVAVHIIADINKTQRVVSLRGVSGGAICVGKPLERLLIGVFFRNKHLSASGLEDGRERDSVRLAVQRRLAHLLRDERTRALPLYEEAAATTARSEPA